MSFSSDEQRRNYYREYYKKRRIYYLEKLGGKCLKCGSKNNLNFDHTDRNSKLFPISKLMSYSRLKIERELKCQLLCRDCHKEKTKRNKEYPIRRIYKLNPDQIIEIKSLIDTGISLRSIAKKFNVSHVNILYIKNRKLWKNA